MPAADIETMAPVVRLGGHVVKAGSRGGTGGGRRPEQRDLVAAGRQLTSHRQSWVQVTTLAHRTEQNLHRDP